MIVASALMRRVLAGAAVAEVGQAVGELRAAVDGPAGDRPGSGRTCWPGPPHALDRQPKYLRIYTEPRDRISSGRWPAGHPACPRSASWPPSSASA